MLIEIVSETAATNEIRAEVAANLTNILEKRSIEINGTVLPIAGTPMIIDSTGDDCKLSS